MNRADTVKGILVWEQVADAAKAKAAALRADLNADATAELKEQGTAPTWRLPGIGTATLPVTQESAYVADEALFAAWVEERYPDQAEHVTRVRPAFVTALLGRIVIEDGAYPVDVEYGEVVPGLAVRPGGEPKSVSIRADSAIRGDLREVARLLLDGVQASITGDADVPASPAVEVSQ